MGVLTARRPLIALVVGVAVGCFRPAPTPTTAAHVTDTAAVDRLLGLLAARLAVAHDVARVKWNTGRPIEDLDRERELLTRVSERGRDAGLDPAFVKSLFAAQIAAGKRLQRADHERWRAAGQGPFADAVPLADLRTRLDRIEGEILAALPAALSAVANAGVPAAVPARAAELIPDVDAETRAVATTPLTTGP